MHRLKNLRNIVIGLFATLLLVLSLAACTSDGKGDAQSKETKTGQSNYERLAAKQPANDMEYSPTRDTIKFFNSTWGKPGKNSYVYLQNAEGKLLGYYVLRGLPVNYCVSLRPNYKIITPEITGDNNVPLVVPAPSSDGVYYGSGAGCNTYYGRDAQTGAYIEYTVGLGINVLLYDQPLTENPNVPNLTPGKK